MQFRVSSSEFRKLKAPSRQDRKGRQGISSVYFVSFLANSVVLATWRFQFSTPDTRNSKLLDADVYFTHDGRGKAHPLMSPHRSRAQHSGASFQLIH